MTARYEGRLVRTLIHVIDNKDGHGLCSISICTNHVREDYPGCKREYSERAKADAALIVEALNAQAIRERESQ